jgi:dephospho-CoA kinase
MYEAYQTAESSGVPYIIHDDAQDALRVIMADNKAELTELAVEFGKPEDEYHGLSSKALREYLLRHFHANIG